MNRDGDKRQRQPNPVSNASFLSKLTFWWLKPILTVGLKRTIEEDDIYDVTTDMRSDQNTDAFSKLWDLELKKQKPSIWRVMLKLHGFQVISLGILFSVFETLSRVFQPICLGGFVAYFAQSEGQYDIPLRDAYWYASGIVLSTAFMVLTFHPFILVINKTACKVRVACSGLVYQKSLRLLRSSTKDGQNGHIINLLSNDLAKFDLGLSYLHDVWKGPMEAIAYFIVIYLEIGLSGVVGMAFLTSFIPLQIWISRKSAELRLKNTIRTDVRVKVMNEILFGIQVIKMYAWEKSFAKMVDQIRKREVSAIRSIAYIRATINSFTMISKLSIFLSLITYVYLGNAITARKVFIVSSYFNILNLSMVYFWPVAITYTAEAYISIKRLQEFLLRPESKQSTINSNDKSTDSGLNNVDIKNGVIITQTDTKTAINENKHENLTDKDNNILNISPTQKLIDRRVQNTIAVEKFVRFEDATAVWQFNESHQMNGIFDFNVEIKPGLCAVVGPVGSGKSTLLNVILGELELDSGLVTINGSISYASQEPWLFEGSVRSNIVFVEDFDEQRYKKVVEVCALERDFQLLPHGDTTIIGERGCSLSGGQKARVNLARAIYKRSDIYLLDDPLSAVDTHVGKHIFEQCVTEFLKDNICILVTHQLQYLRNVNHVILLRNGTVHAEGSFQSLQTLHKELLMYAQNENEGDSDDCIQKQTRKLPSSTSFNRDKIEDTADDRKEHQLTGSMKFGTYKAYFKAANNQFYVIVVFIVFVLAQVASSGADYFLSFWVNWEEAVSKGNSTVKQKEREPFLITYSCIMIVGSICYFCRSFSFFNMCLRISINLHEMIFRGISRAKMIFFNNNPSGRILNRFAKDINNVDSLVPHCMVDVINYFLQYLAIVVINVTVNPWLLIPAIVMTILSDLLRRVFLNAGRSFIRLEALSRSPIYSHTNATLQGLATVRVFNAKKILETEFHKFQDHNISCYYLYLCSSRWFAACLDIVCLLFIAFVTFSFLLFGDGSTQSGQVGLAILSSINLMGTYQWGIRRSVELESQMTSVERLLEYSELPSEPALESDSKNAPPKDWPKFGHIEFKSLHFRYAENSARILRNLTFQIDAKQKIGIVGRTGAGKSSIVQSLFRLAQNQGHIWIDGIDIGVIGLHDLRKKISIIPQEAVLFSGSLRFNLDPFNEKNDDELWESLNQVELKTVVSALPGGLDTKIMDGGSNFSAGQRQLLCLARAILRNNKILILDEATANVDSQTDKLIQETIRRKFADCTVITIAHRLHTIMDSDKILVMDAGEVVEFDHPFELIRKPDGFFKRMLEQTGNSTAKALGLMAQEKYDNDKLRKLMKES